jgi:hypothetical protein
MYSARCVPDVEYGSQYGGLQRLAHFEWQKAPICLAIAVWASLTLVVHAQPKKETQQDAFDYLHACYDLSAGFFDERRLRSSTTRLFNGIEDRKLTGGQCVAADRLREQAVGTLKRPMQQLNDVGTWCALNHHTEQNFTGRNRDRKSIHHSSPPGHETIAFPCWISLVGAEQGWQSELAPGYRGGSHPATLPT